MTKSKLSLQVAKLLGWELRQFGGWCSETQENFSEMRWFKNGRNMAGDTPPDYAGSLDAMYQAWQTLTDYQKLEYQALLWQVVKRTFAKRGWAVLAVNSRASLVSNATALQRARTFVLLRREAVK